MLRDSMANDFTGVDGAESEMLYMYDISKSEIDIDTNQAFFHYSVGASIPAQLISLNSIIRIQGRHE